MAESPDKQPTIEDLLEDPVYDNEGYAVVILEKFIPQVGTGMYGVVNKELGVVEISNPELPVAIEACNHLEGALQKARMSFLAKPEK